MNKDELKVMATKVPNNYWIKLGRIRIRLDSIESYRMDHNNLIITTKSGDTHTQIVTDYGKEVTAGDLDAIFQMTQVDKLCQDQRPKQLNG